MKEKHSALFWFALTAYVLILLLLLFNRSPQMGRPYNLRPLKTIRDYCIVLGRDDPSGLALRPYAVFNFAGNLLAFVPLGLFLPILFRRQRSFLLFLLTSAVGICLIELLQYATRRGALDIDDLILNLPGAVLGWLLWLAGKREARREKRPDP